MARPSFGASQIKPDPNPEESAAIMAALEVALEDDGESAEAVASRKRSRWRLAGLLGHAPPRGMRLEGALWSYASREGMV